jgi:hypothetical protein
MTDELENMISEMEQSAKKNYDIDPVLTLIRSLEHNKTIHGPEGERFQEGYGAAIHHVKFMYIAWSGEFSCDCDDNPTNPEKHVSGDWVCGRCDTLITTGITESEREQ